MEEPPERLKPLLPQSGSIPSGLSLRHKSQRDEAQKRTTLLPKILHPLPNLLSHWLFSSCILHLPCRVNGVPVCSTTRPRLFRDTGCGSFDCAYPTPSPVRCQSTRKTRDTPPAVGEGSLRLAWGRGPQACREAGTIWFSGSWAPRRCWEP